MIVRYLVLLDGWRRSWNVRECVILKLGITLVMLIVEELYIFVEIGSKDMLTVRYSVMSSMVCISLRNDNNMCIPYILRSCLCYYLHFI